MKFEWLSLPVLLLYSGAVPAEWESTADSSFSFETTFEGEPIGGAFRQFEVRFDFDPDSPEDAHLVVTVHLGAADMGDADMNAVLFDEAWFDVSRFDSAVFESCHVETTSAQEFVADGILKLKDYERRIEVPFAWATSGSEAHMHGELTLHRTDFGVGTGEWADGETIGLDVRLSFDVELEQAD